MTMGNNSTTKKRYFTTVQVSELLGISDYTIRYWQKNMGLSLTERGGRFYYQNKDIELLKKISYLVRDRGYTLKAALGLIGQQSGMQASLSEAKEKLQQAIHLLQNI